MSAQHAPGRLRLFDTYVDPEIRDDNDKLVAVVLAEKANSARRLVACWNACEGISTDELETTGGAAVGWTRTASKLIHATTQRDALLAALNGLLAYFESGNSVPVSQATIKASSAEVLAARAAIAKAGGEA